MIRKLPNKNKWKILSKSTHVVNGIPVHKNLGVFSSKAKAEKHEQDIQFFKHLAKVKKR